MEIRRKILNAGIVIFFCILVVAQTAEDGSRFRSGETLLPEVLQRPKYGEELRFPQDYVIGDLGRCDASEESYRYARLVIASLAAGNGNTEGVQFPEQKRLSVVQNIAVLGTRNWRVGGGRVEPDGSVSFLVRFLGREKSITGEIYLRKEEPKPETEEDNVYWHVDDVLLESPRSLAEGKYGPGGANMTAYERFF